MKPVVSPYRLRWIYEMVRLETFFKMSTSERMARLKQLPNWSAKLYGR
jgi:hypothetical protein